MPTEIKVEDLERLFARSTRSIMEEFAGRFPAPSQVAAAQDQPGAPAADPANPGAIAPTSVTQPDGTVVQMGARGIADTLDAEVRVPWVKVELPVWGALSGLSTGVVVGAVVDTVVSPQKADGSTNWINPVAQIGAATAAVKYGRHYFGDSWATFTAGSLLMKVALRHTPLADWLQKATTKSQEYASKVKLSQDTPEHGVQASPAFNQPDKEAPPPMRPTRSLAFA